MTQNPRTVLVKFMTTEGMRRALKLRSGLEAKPMGDVIIDALTVHLTPDFEELKRRGLIHEVPAKGEPKKAAKQ
jgi:hypothetical protein